MLQPRILVHLGASEVPKQFWAESLEYVRLAVKHGSEVAHKGGKAEDIVSETVSVLEDCPVSDAGRGSVFNGRGHHQMDAGIMTGDKRYGAILSIHNVRNPIQVARLMADDPKFSILCGQGAMDFIDAKGIEKIPDDFFETDYNKYIQNEYGAHGDPLDLFVNPFDGPEHGTVGCVVRDVYGNIAAGTSTGGTPFAPLGRVGDSPFPGCGVWADNDTGCVSCTGYGEKILPALLGARAADNLKTLPAMEAAKKAIKDFETVPRAVGGLIMISRKYGEYGIFHNTEHMPYAFLDDNGEITSGMTVNELKNKKL